MPDVAPDLSEVAVQFRVKVPDVLPKTFGIGIKSFTETLNTGLNLVNIVGKPIEAFDTDALTGHYIVFGFSRLGHGILLLPNY